MSKIDDLLKKELQADFVPSDELNNSILRKAKETHSMKRNSLKSSVVAAAAVVGIITVGSVSVYAAYHYLTPSQVADELMENKSLSKAFESSDAIMVNETKLTAGYQVTLLGIVTGKDLVPAIQDVENSQMVNQGKTYAVVAIENADKSPMPESTENAYKTFCISPLIHGQSWMDVNNGTISVGVSSFVQDGIQYELLECDNLEIFAGVGVSLGVVSNFGEEMSAFQYDTATGLYSVNPEYQGINALFDLPLDTSKADDKAVEEYLQGLQEQESEPDEEEENVSEAEEWMEQMHEAGNSTLSSWDFVKTNAKQLEEYTQVVTPDEEGYITYGYDSDGDEAGADYEGMEGYATYDSESNTNSGKMYVGDWKYEAGVEAVIGSQSDGTMEGTVAESLTKEKDGTFRLKRYAPVK